MTLSCDDAQRAIVWLLDDEVEPAQMLELEEHLSGCVECRETLEHESRLRETIRRSCAAITAPPMLRHRIREALDRERSRQSRLAQAWPAIAAAAVLLALIWKGTDGRLPDLDEAAQHHARNLPLDVQVANVAAVSQSQVQQVQQYLNGKLPFAVQVPRLTETSPVHLMGGRVTRLRDREAAYLRYDIPRGRVAVFVYEDRGANASEVASGYTLGRQRMVVQRIRGYTVARWRASGLVYSVVTNLPPSEIPTIFELGAR